MSLSKTRYYAENIQAIWQAAGGRINQKHLHHDYLREKISSRKPDFELTAAAADFWLELDQLEGGRRRASSKPPSPFLKRGRQLVASRDKVAVWDDEWRKAQLAAQLRQFMRPLRGNVLKSQVEDFLKKIQPMCLVTHEGQARIVGHAAWLPASADTLDPAAIDIAWMRPIDALKRPWLSKQASLEWLTLVRAAQKLQLDDLEALQAQFNTASAPGARKGDGRL